MPARLRPTRLEHVVDGVRLRAHLSAAALESIGDEAAQRKAALEVLRAALFRGRMIAKERLENGAGGIESVRLLAGVTDEVVSALYDFTTVHVIRSRNPTEGERLAVVAVGGYGRGALAPFSDIDLLFLRPYKTTPYAESVIEFMLYALWDLGFKVGHASRTADECIRLARNDFTIRTALLEARHLCGDAALTADLKRRFRTEIVRGTAAEFVAAKLKERDERHARAGASRYMVEPNVKEGKGALRDLNTLFWIVQYLHPVENPAEMVKLDLFTGRETRAFLRAFDFFWAVRSHLHFATGRAEERLTFDLQPEIAVRMGYGERRVRPLADSEEADPVPAVERFMRRYFLIAKEVGALTRVFSAKLEAEQVKSRPSRLSRFLPGRKDGHRSPVGVPGFLEEGGRLTVKDEGVFERDPLNLLRLFLIADRREYDLHPDAFTAASRSLNLITPAMRSDAHAARTFMDIVGGRSPYRTLTLMNDAGVLGRFLPEFGRVVAQMQFNMYHSYTVDEHTLRALGIISDIEGARLRDDHPLATSIFPLIGDREALYLAMLLHDTGKGQADGQEIGGARTARAACERLGLAPERTAFIAWLVQHHLVMSDYAQKRDVSDPRTVAAFAGIVQNPERLRALLVLTVADIRAVGPGVWNGWKGQLLRELYAAAEAVFRGGRDADPETSFRRRQQATAADARDRLIAADRAAAPFAAAMDDAYFAAATADEQLSHAHLTLRAEAQGGAAAAARIRDDRNAAEIVVAARDRRGLFADLAGVVAGLGANVVGARVHTSADGQALDVFHVQDASGGAYGKLTPGAPERLARALEAAARGERVAAEPRRLGELGRAAAFDIAATVAVDNEASKDCTVVEVSGRDRPGLLDALARTLAEAGLSIQSAHIDNYGERAVDAFYVQTDTGAKVAEPARLNALKTALAEVLSEDPRAPVIGRPRLQRARASIAR
jgi:[protein-PII] uridylyltransferase